jgi:hypothetical protein
MLPAAMVHRVLRGFAPGVLFAVNEDENMKSILLPIAAGIIGYAGLFFAQTVWSREPGASYD